MTLTIKLELTDGQIRASVSGKANLSCTAPTISEAVAGLQAAYHVFIAANPHLKETDSPITDAQADAMPQY